MKKTSGGIHLKNVCTKFEVNLNIIKIQNSGELMWQTDGQCEKITNSAYMGVLKLGRISNQYENWDTPV